MSNRESGPQSTETDQPAQFHSAEELAGMASEYAATNKVAQEGVVTDPSTARDMAEAADPLRAGLAELHQSGERHLTAKRAQELGLPRDPTLPGDFMDYQLESSARDAERAAQERAEKLANMDPASAKRYTDVEAHFREQIATAMADMDPAPRQLETPQGSAMETPQQVRARRQAAAEALNRLDSEQRSALARADIEEYGRETNPDIAQAAANAERGGRRFSRAASQAGQGLGDVPDSSISAPGALLGADVAADAAAGAGKLWARIRGSRAAKKARNRNNQEGST